MKIGYAFLFATTALVLPAQAENYRVASKIGAVKVFPQGADVTRIAHVSVVEGDHQIILDNVPGWIDPQSIRVEGAGSSGIEITSVDSKSTPLVTENIDVSRRKLEQEIARLSHERSGLDQQIADIDTQRQLIMSLSQKQLVPSTSSETLKSINAGELGSLLDVVGTRMAALAKATQEARVRQADIDMAVADLQTQMSLLAPQEGYKTGIVVHVASPIKADADFKITYRINEAGWQPYYDAKLTTPGRDQVAQLDLVRRAEVMQSTAETWDDVALTLSTARPSGTTTAPDLQEEEIVVQADIARRKDEMADAAVSNLMEEDKMDVLGKSKPGVSGKVQNEAAKPTAAPVAQRQAIAEIAGYQINYVIGGAVSIDNSGMSKRVRISSEKLATKLSALTVPRQDSNAYLMANFVAQGEGPMLPGHVNLYRDGVYVGQGALPLLNKGEDARLGFGADDLIKVQRAEVKRRTGEEGLLSSSHVSERAWDISVRNMHDFAIAVTVLDKIPFASNDEIVITESSSMTPPTERNVDKKRGVLAWKFDLDSKAQNTISVGYKVSWPETVQVGSIE